MSVRVTSESEYDSQEESKGHRKDVCLNGAASDLQVQENLVNVPIATFASVMARSDYAPLGTIGCSTNMSGTSNSFVLSKLFTLSERSPYPERSISV